MHRIRSVHDPDRPDMRPQRRQWRILGDALAAITLHRAVDDRQGHVGSEDFGLCDFGEGGFRSGLVDRGGGVEDDEAGGVDFHAGEGDLLDDAALLGDEFAEGFLAGVVGAGEHPFEGEFGGADGAHGVVDAAGAHAALHDFEAAAVAEDDVGGGDADVLEEQVGVAVGGVVEAVDFHHALDGNAGGAGVAEDDGLAFVFVGVVGLGAAEDHVELAAWVTGAGDPPFAAVDHVLVAVFADVERNVGGVGGGDVGFCHHVGGSNLAF